MDELATQIARARSSLYFSGARIEEHLGDFLDKHGDECGDLGSAVGQSNHLFLAGSGGSLASLQTAKYLIDAISDTPSDVLPSYELAWRHPARLDSDAVAVLASYSGETEDTVAAMNVAKRAGTRTVAVVGRADSTMGREADHCIAYENGAIFEIPIAAVVLLAAGMAVGSVRQAQGAELASALAAIPHAARKAVDAEEQVAESRARGLLHATHIFVLGAGPLAPLAYKLAMSVVMENVRIGATYSDASEWRHGPAEALERLRPDMVFLVGTDASRDLTLRTVDFCTAQGARVVTYDAAEFAGVHPLLTPLVMNSVTQWLIVYSALLRGISDLDSRVFMGHNVLAAGGHPWP